MAGGKAKGTSLRSEKRTTRIDKDVKKVSATNKLLSYAYDLLWSYRTWVDCSVTVVVFVDTEIDWKAYMQQVTQFKNGERDYLNIRGDTGPLVYPAGHVYIYSILHWVTNNGQDIRLGRSPILQWERTKETSVIRFFCFMIVRSERVPIRVERIVTSLCVVNFVGICFARTLHYQFYAWYFPTLPYLLWKTNMPLIFKAKVLIICEFAFNTFPATDVSSTVLHLSHFMLLASLFTASDESKYQSYLDAETRQDLTHFVNEECFDAARQFAMYYGSVTEELAEGAKVVSIDEQEIVLRLPKMNFTLAIGFGSSAPVTTEGYARRVLSGMSKEAEDGLARGVNMGQ
ncbi:hypothetical protein DYB28_013016, partial [Aphanomyces astaci]